MNPQQNPEQELESFRQQKHEQWNTPAELVASLVEKAVGSPLLTQQRIIAGETNEVYSAKTESGKEVIVRIFHGEKSRFEKERWALEQCTKAGVPVPEVFLVESNSLDSKPLHVCVESKLPGVNMDKALKDAGLDKKELHADLMHQLGGLLSKIHSVETKGFGILNGEGKGKFASVKELIEGDTFIDNEKILSGLKDNPEQMEIAKKADEILKKEAASYGDELPRLVHNDLSPQHILVHEGKISGIIDFESAVGANPAADFARWEQRHGKTYPIDLIKEGYEDTVVFADDFERRLNFWKIYRSFTSLRYCIDQKKKMGIEAALQGLREAVAYFEKAK